MCQNIFYLAPYIDLHLQKKEFCFYAQKNKIKGTFFDINQLNSFVSKKDKQATLFINNILCLGQNLETIQKQIHLLIENGINIISIKEGFEIFSNTKGRNILTGMQMSSQISSICKSQIIKNKLAQKRKNGGIVGRHKGSKNLIPSKCETNKEYILSSIKNGKTKKEIATEIGVSTSTLFNFLKPYKELV